MKIKLICFSIVMLMAAALLKAQQPQAGQHGSFKDSSNTLYYNRNLPVYLFISSSPNPDAPAHLLRSEQSKAYTNPMYFGTDGYQTIRSPWQVDTTTKRVVYPKRDIVFGLHADGSPPSLKLEGRHTKQYVDPWDTTLYFGRGLKIHMPATDAASGVEAVYVSVNGENFTQTSGPLSFQDKTEGRYTVVAYATDNVGNACRPDTLQFEYDTTPPKGRIVLHGVQQGEKLLSRHSKLLLRARDSLSGTCCIYYSLNGDDFTKYTEPIAVGELPDGTYNFQYYTEDYVGNISRKKNGELEYVNFDFEVDKKPPEVAISTEGDVYQKGKTFISGRTAIKVSAEDKKGRVVWTGLSINSTTDYEAYNAPVKIPGRDGYYTIRAKARDFVGNVSQAASAAYYKDATPPSTAIDYVGKQFFNRDTLFIHPNTEVKLIPRDEASGVSGTQYQIGNGDKKRYGQPFSLPGAGFHTITFTSSDNVNNQETEKQSGVYVDATPPAIHAYFNVKPFKRQTHQGEQLKVYPTYTKLYLGATDNKAGTRSIHYSINGGPLQDFASPNSITQSYLLRKEDVYTVQIIAKDLLGNTAEKEIKFIVRKK